MYVRHFVGAAVLLALGAQALAAQDSLATPAAPRPVLVAGFTVGSLEMNPDAAARAEVGDRSYGLELYVGAVFKRRWYLGMDLGGQFLDDHAEFTENTTGGERKSTANVTYLSALAGVRTGTLGPVPVAMGLNVGASASMTRRSIDNCVDCSVDKLSIPGGGFVEPVLMFGRRRARLRVSDRVYFAGNGMRSVISLGLDYQARTPR